VIADVRVVAGDALLVAGKDLRLEARSRVALNHVLPFVLSVVLIFAFALDPDSGVLRRATGGLFWVTVLFASVLLVQRSFGLERHDGIPDALRLSGLRPAGIFLGKVLALAVQLVVVELLLGLSVVVFYDVHLRGYLVLVTSALAATLAIAAAGSVYGPLASGLRVRDTALPLLLVPVLAPVLLSATNAFGVALRTSAGGGWPWAGMLGIVAVLYLTLGTAVWGPLLEET
jgi:heme exporter protein B